MAAAPSTIFNVIKFSQVSSLVKEIVAHPMDFGCVGFVGAPGVGKTQVIEDVCAAKKKALSYINCSLVGPGELLGAAFPSEDRRYTDFLPTRMLDEESVIFFDELANGSRELMNLANRVLLSGELNGRRFKQARLFACNPTTVSELAENLPTILVNKAFLEVVDYRWDDFNRYALNEGHKKIHPGVAAFIQETKDACLQVKDYTPMRHDGVEAPEPGNPFPSPRSYELFSGMMRRIESGALDLTSYDAAYATVGAVAGKKLADYLTCAKYLPKTPKILAGEDEIFPEEAYIDGNVMTPIQMMTLYNIMAGIQNKTEMAAGSRWLFNQVKHKVLGTELLKTFAAALQESRFKDVFPAVVGEVGKDVLGGAEFSKFMIGAIARDLSAGKF